MLRRAQLPPRASAGKRKRPQHLGEEAREAAVSGCAGTLAGGGIQKPRRGQLAVAGGHAAGRTRPQLNYNANIAGFT